MADTAWLRHNRKVPIKTAVYRVSRSDLMLLTGAEYVRSFWWFIAITPLFGVAAIAFGSGLLQIVGWMAILWPFSIPARAVLSTRKSARLFSDGCWMEAESDRVVFFGEQADPKRLRLIFEARSLRDVVDRGRFLLVRQRRFGFAPVPKEAFAPGEAEQFREIVQGLIEKANSYAV